ncbi:60S ribosomal protein L23a [Microtus ochrogaster]|uniref:60S ribosomal protein L23a n=1 Tax=Microtus ochrogaster TaxID=79684 RepID=A0A8J6H4L5_MICOH|nr:60S ribosomal protein L23a [Microtus ochrogaster]
MEDSEKIASCPSTSYGFRRQQGNTALVFPLPLWIISYEDDITQYTVFTVDAKANKHQIKEAVEKLYGTDMAKVNTLIRPDGGKAYVQLVPDSDALDVTNKIGII